MEWVPNRSRITNVSNEKLKKSCILCKSVIHFATGIAL